MKVAVIGLGSAGSRHARIAGELDHEVVGYDPVAEPPEGVGMADSPEAAFARADAAIIASPNSAHAEHALAAIGAGLPTLVEKPLATTATDAGAVSTAAERASVVCAMAMSLRFHPGPETLKGLIEDGTLGDILFARASFGYDLRKWRPQDDYRKSYSARADLGGGILLDAIHEVDELLWLLGPASSVSAELAHLSDLEIDVEDTALVQVQFASGALGALDLNFWEPSYRRGCLVAGSKAVAEWDWVKATVVVTEPHGADREIPCTAEPEQGYRAELADFFAAIERGVSPRTSVTEGAAAVELVEAAKLSAAESRRVPVPLSGLA